MMWLDEVRQTATLDEAEQLASRLLQEPFAAVRESYADIGFDVVSFANGLASLVVRARRARSSQRVAQNRYELQSGERRGGVGDVKKWIDQLHAAGRYAKANKLPLGDKLPKLAFTSEVDAETWSQCRDGMKPVLENLDELGDLARFGLPDDFYDRGVVLYDQLAEDRDDSVFEESKRLIATPRLERLLDLIVEDFEKIVTARDLVMELTGEELPGLELSLVKSAAASRSGPSEPEPEPEVRAPVVPTLRVAEPDDTTGL